MEKNQLDSPKWYLFISDRNPQTFQSLLSLQCMMILPKVGIAQGAGKVTPSPSSGRPGLSSQKPWRPSSWRLTPDPQALYLRGRVHLGCLQHFILTQFCSIVLELLKTTIIFLLNKSSLFSFLSHLEGKLQIATLREIVNANHHLPHPCFLSCCHLVVKSCLIFCNPMDHSRPGSFIHGIFQARILECVATSSSRGSSGPRNQTHISCVPCIGRQILYHWAPRKVHVFLLSCCKLSTW